MDSFRKTLLVSALGNHNNGSPAYDASGPIGDTPTASFVSRILQVALGLFVTSMELPSLSPELRANPSVTFDCDFSVPCRWSSIGSTADRWKLTRGEPDSILWLAATGTMVQPAEPFALLEVREGRLADMLGSETINCQEGSSLFSFTYWTVGSSDLEICLLDIELRRFNCTGMLQTKVQPGKVALKIPPVKQTFHIAIIPSRNQGVLVVDEIKYDARYCMDNTSPSTTTSTTTSTPTSPSPSPLPTLPTWVPRSFPTTDPPLASSTPFPTSFPPLIQIWSSTTPWTAWSTLSTSPLAFISPTPSPMVGPHSTDLPLPNPFTLGPSLPMGPLILPPLLPGPPSGIVNPFVVAPLIPATSTAPFYSPEPIIVTAVPTPPTPSTSATTTSTMMPSTETTMPMIPSIVAPTTEMGMATRSYTEATPDPAFFTSTVIPARTRPRTITKHSATIPWETGIPNILVHATTTVQPLPSFELLIVGSRTRPFFDRRLGKITEQTDDLLCDFSHSFPCLWGAETGRWAVVHKGAIPSLDEELDSEEDESPQYPAVIVIQGTAMLSSDPLRCQSGEGKLLFRYWTNGRVLIQVCAMGWAVDSPKIQCVEEVAQHSRMDPSSLAVFELSDPIREPFTLNVVPIWERNAHNNYLMIDEIAYIGECNLTALNEIDEEEQQKREKERGNIDGKGNPKVVEVPWGTSSISTIVFSPFPSTQAPKSETKKFLPTFTPKTTIEAPQSSRASTPQPPLTYPHVAPSAVPPSRPRPRPHLPRPHTRRPLPISPITQPTSPEDVGHHHSTPTTTTVPTTTVHPALTKTTTLEPPFWLSSKRPGTRYPFYPSTPTPPLRPFFTKSTTPMTTIDPLDLIMKSTREGQIVVVATTTTDSTSDEEGGVTTIYPGIAPLKKKKTTARSTKGSFTIPYTTTQKYGPTQPPYEQNYCKLLNCDFNENACHYLNHGLTKVPWTLRTRGYGFPLSRNTDLRPTLTNGQFVSTVLGPGDFAILESPRFNLTEGINVLLFQYFRPTHSSTIRLCLGTRYTKPLRTVAAFLQCPPILRSITSKHSPAKWNSVHIQLPPGTSHFYLVAHNLDRSAEKAAIAIDNIRVAICDPRAVFDPEDPDYVELGDERVPVSPTPPPPPVDSNELYVDLPEAAVARRHRSSS